MERKMKIGWMWLTVENYDYEIRVNKDYDLILEEVTRY